MRSNAALLESVSGQRIALRSVNIDGSLQDLFAEITVTQKYVNDEPITIEAVYSFPLPLDATLLGLDVTLGERSLTGVIVEKTDAEERYEDAVTEGNSAILLQKAGPGLYTMNVGNLQPGETVSIRFRYALLQRWNGANLRFMLPTTLAPRYGAPTSLAPHQVPDYSVFANLTYSLRLQVQGLLADSDITSPSHTISRSASGSSTIVELAEGSTALDRDFVLNFHSKESTRATALMQPDFDGYIALLSFKPALGNTLDASPRSIKVVVDCSGSMAGDSIYQARVALLRILGTLRPQDYFNIVAFGSQHTTLFPNQLPASAANLSRAHRFVDHLDADMGGTELGEALKAAYASLCETDISQDLLLITDGEIWDYATVVDEGRQSQHRIFTVGVGSAVAEPFARTLAESCGGVCELVSPNEDMAERIYRHFQRIFSPCTKSVAVTWPKSPKDQFPSTVGPVYVGDTVHLYAWFDTKPVGEVTVSITLPDGQEYQQQAPLTPFSATAPTPEDLPVGALPRLAVGSRLTTLENAKEATNLATRYQLMSPWTHYLVIDTTDEASKTDDLPALRKVPQMLAAGWGGTSTVMHCYSRAPEARIADANYPVIRHRRGGATAVPPAADDIDYLDIPAFLRRTLDTDEQPSGIMTIAGAFADRLNRLPSTWFAPRLRLDSLDALEAAGLESSALDALRSIIKRGYEEKTVVFAFLHLLVQSPEGKTLHRDVSRSIRRAFKGMKVVPSITTALETVLVALPRWEM